jgi:site-specific recombinase XerD
MRREEALRMSVHTYIRKKDGATVYCAVFYGPGGGRKVRKVRAVRKDGTVRDHERAATAALKSAQDNRVAVENDEWRDPKLDRPRRITFEKLVEKFLKNYNSRTGSVEHYKQRLDVALAAFGSSTVEDVTPQTIDRFRKTRAADVSPTTVRQDLVALSSLFRWAIARKLATTNPASPDVVKRPTKARPDPHPLTDGEVVALLDACTKAPARNPDVPPKPRTRKKPYAEGEIGYPWLEPMLELALATGADRSELIGLAWHRHVDRDRKLLRLPRAKTGVDRTIPYGGNAAISRILSIAWTVRHPSGSVFLHDGVPVKPQAAKTAMRRVWKRAGITKPRPWKTLRATFATRKAEAGVDVPTLAGLTTSHVLEHYVKPSGVHLAGAMADVAPSTGLVASN